MNETKIKIGYSAPGKVIFSGEHAVVYEKPALVCAINLRVEFILFPKFKTTFFRSDKNCYQKNIFSIEKIVKEFLITKKIKFIDKKFNFKINSSIPIGRGLGSSAALSTTAVSSFLEFFSGISFDKKIVNNLAYQAEKIFHKNPSGVDNTTACFGGLIYYRKEFEFLKNINQLSFNIPKEIKENLFLIDSGKPKETTATMVSLVKENYSKKIEIIFSKIEKITKKMVLALKEKNISQFEKTIYENEKLLEKLGVVSKKTKKLLRKLSQFGVGKITGAGGKEEGSGFILFFADKKEKLIDFLKKQKINYFKFTPDCSGLVKIKNDQKN